jgi:acetyl esterase/lipase
MVKIKRVILVALFSGLSVMARGVEGRERSTEQPKGQSQAADQAAGYPASVPQPTLREIAYGPHKRNVLDFWKAAANRPTPLVFVIHGGGWQNGSKERLNRFVDTTTLLKEEISVVAINYRYIRNAGDIQPPVRAPLEDAARALQFVRSKADEWNIDKERIAAAGSSAGACSSLWLLYHDDLADMNSEDSVAHESTRLFCAAVNNAQTTLDPKQMKEWTPNSRYGGHAFGINGFAAFFAERENILPWIQEYSPYALVTPDDPPVYLFYKAAPSVGKPQKDPTHTANFGVKLQQRCVELGLQCELMYPHAAGAVHEDATSYLITRLQSPVGK